MRYVLLLAIVCVVGVFNLTSCGPKPQPTTEVTGKGNGGNGLAMSKIEIERRLQAIKPRLVQLFKGLRDLAAAETLSSGSTDLSEFPKLKKLIQEMVDPNPGVSVFEDIQTEGNIKIIDEPCIDFQGFENAAAAAAGAINDAICFSISELRKISPKGAETTVDIQILSIAAHEFGHHYLESDEPEEDENLLRTFQAFINYQLHKFDQLPTEGVVSTSDLPLLDRFSDHAKGLLEQVRASAALRKDL